MNNPIPWIDFRPSMYTLFTMALDLSAFLLMINFMSRLDAAKGVTFGIVWTLLGFPLQYCMRADYRAQHPEE